MCNETAFLRKIKKTCLFWNAKVTDSSVFQACAIDNLHNLSRKILKNGHRCENIYYLFKAHTIP